MDLKKLSDSARDALINGLDEAPIMLRCEHNSQRNNITIHARRPIYGSSQCSVTSIGIFMSGFSKEADSDKYVYRIGRTLGHRMFSSSNFVPLMQRELNRFGVDGRVIQLKNATRENIRDIILSGSPVLPSTRSIDPPYPWPAGYRPKGHFWPIIGFWKDGVIGQDPWGDGSERYRGGRSGKYILYTWKEFDGWTVGSDIAARKIIYVNNPEPGVEAFSIAETTALLSKYNPGVNFG